MNRYTVKFKDGTRIDIIAHHTGLWRDVYGYEQLDFYLNDEYGNEIIIALMNLKDIYRVKFTRLSGRDQTIKV